MLPSMPDIQFIHVPWTSLAWEKKKKTITTVLSNRSLMTLLWLLYQLSDANWTHAKGNYYRKQVCLWNDLSDHQGRFLLSQHYHDASQNTEDNVLRLCHQARVRELLSHRGWTLCTPLWEEAHHLFHSPSTGGIRVRSSFSSKNLHTPTTPTPTTPHSLPPPSQASSGSGRGQSRHEAKITTGGPPFKTCTAHSINSPIQGELTLIGPTVSFPDNRGKINLSFWRRMTIRNFQAQMTFWC